jgi:hypothetical protein
MLGLWVRKERSGKKNIIHTLGNFHLKCIELIADEKIVSVKGFPML